MDKAVILAMLSHAANAIWCLILVGIIEKDDTTIELKFIYKKIFCLCSNSHLERDHFSSPELTCKCLVW